jgi:hypothetical protein
MSALNFEDIKNMVEEHIEEIDIKAWPGKTIYMRPMSAKANIEAIGLANGIKDADQLLKLKKVVLQAVLCDDRGQLLFDMKNIDELFKLDCQVVYQLYEEATKRNFPQPDEVEQIAKN